MLYRIQMLRFFKRKGEEPQYIEDVTFVEAPDEKEAARLVWSLYPGSEVMGISPKTPEVTI